MTNNVDNARTLVDAVGSYEQKDGDIDREKFTNRVKSFFYNETTEDDLVVLPRVDGRTSSPWRPQDIGFFLPSHYFEREDGETPRSLAVPADEWNRSVDGMNNAIRSLKDAAAYEDLVGGAQVPIERRRAAAAIFLADLSLHLDNADASALEQHD